MNRLNRKMAQPALVLIAFAALAIVPAAEAASSPEAITGPNTPHPGGKVHLLGYVDPEGMPVTACKFVYGPEAGNYDQELPCANHPGSEIQAFDIAAIGGTYRLKFEGEATGELPFDATAEEVQSALRALPAVGSSGVTVRQQVDTADFRRYLVSFEGPLADTDVGQLEGEKGSEPLQFGPEQAPAFWFVAATLDQGGLGGPREVIADLTGLAPGATYHYRLVAGNGAGQTESSDAVFKAAETEPSACTNEGALGVSFLPECRAWEMVSPSQKNGGDILTLGESTRIAADGSAASFASYSRFGDASGAGVSAEYESLRTDAGWVTHGIFPRQPPGSFYSAVQALFPHYMGEMSPDMERGFFYATAPLDQSDPNVEAVVNLYLRSDLRTPGAGSYQLLTPCPLCAEIHKPLEGFTGEAAPWIAGASTDGKHVVFESRFNLVKPANSPGTKLYESEEGTVRLVGILPGGGAAPESTASGPHFTNQWFPHTPRTVSADGSKIVFTAGADLYLRVNHETTVQLNASELPSPEGDGTARFEEATPDGSKVYFRDGARLTEGAPPSGGIYVYDTTKPASDPHNLLYLGTGTVAGASSSGDTVYLGNSVWRNGQFRTIGNIDPSDARVNRVSADGQLLFDAQHSLPHSLQTEFPGYCPQAGGDALCDQFYTYDPGSEALQCVSCSPAGQPVQETTAELEHTNVGGGAIFTRHTDHPISADGRHVFFATNAALVPEDTNGVSDVYTFNTTTSQVNLLSRGTDPYPSYFMEATASGSDALFTTRQRLSGWDVDSNTDLYDARVGGGLPEPVPVPASCEGEACFNPPMAVPGRSATGSETLSGAGNPPPTCPRGTRLVRKGEEVRCAKRKHKKHHRKKHHHSKHGGQK